MIEKNKVNNVEYDSSKCSTMPESSQGKIMDHPIKQIKGKENSSITFKIEGMTCTSCARKVESALLNCSGVTFAAVNLSEQEATIHFNPLESGPEDLKKAIIAVGYKVMETDANNPEVTREWQGLLSKKTFSNVKPYLFGIATAAGVIGFYLGLLTIVSDWYNATAQFAQYWGWIIALATGLGIQATLFTYIRKLLKGKTTSAVKSSIAASGGVSTASMAACCAHYLVAFLPAFGIPFFSAAAAGLAEYQVEFFFLGVISNVFGIIVMIRTMNKNGLVPAGFLARTLTMGL